MTPKVGSDTNDLLKPADAKMLGLSMLSIPELYIADACEHTRARAGRKQRYLTAYD